MFRFMIKKSFCDDWDNLFTVFIANLICVALAFGCVSLFIFCAKNLNDWITDLVIIASSMIFSVLAFAYGECSAKIANFETSRLVEFFKAIPGCIKDGVLFGLMVSIVGIVSVIGVTYYWSEAFVTQFQLLGIFLGALLIWLDIFFLLAMQWFIPIRSLMHNNFRKCFKKCLLVLFDNTGFSIAMFFHNLILCIISVLFVGLFPGMAGITIANTNAMRLRLYKYDYLEEHPELQGKRQRRKIPWEELIYEDKETLGPRKFKSFLFPWKEG